MNGLHNRWMDKATSNPGIGECMSEDVKNPPIRVKVRAAVDAWISSTGKRKGTFEKQYYRNITNHATRKAAAASPMKAAADKSARVGYKRFPHAS